MKQPRPSSPLPGDVVRAVAWLREHPCEPIALEQLGAAAGVRPRTLEAPYRQFLSTTPRALAKRIDSRTPAGHC